MDFVNTEKRMDGHIPAGVSFSTFALSTRTLEISWIGGLSPQHVFFLEFHLYLTSSFKPGEDTKEEKSSTSTKAKTKETSSEEEADLAWFVAFILPLLVLPCFAYINCQLLVYRSSKRGAMPRDPRVREELTNSSKLDTSLEEALMPKRKCLGRGTEVWPKRPRKMEQNGAEPVFRGIRCLKNVWKKMV